jgi:hypothetical protein
MTSIEFPPEENVDLTISPKKLEVIGHSLSAKQFLNIISNLKTTETLSPLLVGLRAPIFHETLSQISDEQLQSLKQESQTEPLQHHILLFAHFSEEEEKKDQALLWKLQQEIKELDLDSLTFQKIDKIKKRIEEVTESSLKRLSIIDKVLELIWKANRPDLIEKLSLIKERLTRQLSNQIGTASPPTGLYLDLEEKLGTVYQTKESGMLEDDEPAFDGLAQLALWYLKDYWEIGLLPEIKDMNELEYCQGQNTPEQKLKHREDLFAKVQANLEIIKLGTVKELKKEGIYSKPMLKEYIQSHATLLSNKGFCSETH